MIELLNQYSGLFALLSCIIAIVAIIVAVCLSRKSSEQMDRMYKDLDKKRKYSRDYSYMAEFNDIVSEKK